MKKNLPGMLAALGMLFLILDGRTALTGAREAVDLCLYTVIPSLFPFLILSFLLNGMLLGRRISLLRPLGKLCGIPDGGESLLLLGLIGGYPVGAQSVADAYKGGAITKEVYERLLGFCSNGGPSFVFGIIAQQFRSPVVGWMLWLCHMVSALLVGIILPGKTKEVCFLPTQNRITLPQALNGALKVMAKICGWVVLFRVIIAYLKSLPSTQWASTFLFGILELTNGCVNLTAVESESLRFILALAMLNFGGLCVVMQTMSVCGDFGTGQYFPGKCLQTIIGLILAYPVTALLFPHSISFSPIPIIIILGMLILLCSFSAKKQWQFRQKSFIID